MGWCVRALAWVAPLCVFTVSWPVDAHGVVGQRLFLEPMVTADANPANEFDILVPTWTPRAAGSTFAENFSIEKTILSDLSLSLAGEWDDNLGATGFQSPTAALKLRIWRSEEHEGVLSVSAGVTPPLGAAAVGADSSWSWEPMIALGKGFGELPDSFAFVRPFALQANIDGDLSLAAGGAQNVHANLVLEYSLPYLMQQVQDLGLPAPLDRMLPMVEFSVVDTIAGEGAGAFTGFVRPGVMWIGRYTEIGLAANLPLNAASGGAGIMGIVDLFLDDLAPGVFGRPLVHMGAKGE